VLRVPRPSRLPRLPLAPHGRTARRALLLAAVALVVIGAGWMWLRDSSLVRIQRVQVTGVSSSEGADVRRALTSAAEEMTTLHVSHGELMAAVKPFSSVAGVRTRTDFPHRLTIEVTEREPVAEVDIAGEVVPVGAGGRLMRGVRPDRKLPVLHATRLAPGGRLTDPKALAAIATLAAAPQPLRTRVTKVWSGPKGLTLDVRSGPQLFFGAPQRLVAKWMATARVLAEPSAAGAVYLDVRVPERVAAGGLGAVPQEGSDPLALNPQGQELNPQLQAEETPSLNP
jgi:cell division protein FtsQ